MNSKFQANIYGFVEADFIHDTTQNFLDAVNMGAMAPGGTVTGDNGRTQFGARNSRLGVNVTAPEYNGIKASANLEMDFLGNQPSNPPATGPTCTVIPTPTGTTCATTAGQNLKESTFWNNPAFRMRHAYLKIEDDYVSFLIGQYWELIGWQGAFQPNTVEIQGIPGEIYSRTMQLRAYHTFKLSGVTLDIAAAVLRPPQMDSEAPDLQGGIKLAIDGWTGVQTIGATKTGVNPMAVGISGAVRQYKLANTFVASPAYSTTSGYVGAADIMIPLIPASHRGDFAITLLAEGSTGQGDADIFTGLTNGAVNSPNLPTNPPPGLPPGQSPSQWYANKKLNDIDPGLAGWTTTPAAAGVPTLEAVKWQTLIVSAQIYPPIFDGNLWVSATYSNSLSSNIGDFATPNNGNKQTGLGSANLFFNEVFWDANIFVDLTPAVRFGLEYAHFGQNYQYNTSSNTPIVWAQNSRVQFSAFYIF